MLCVPRSLIYTLKKNNNFLFLIVPTIVRTNWWHLLFLFYFSCYHTAFSFFFSFFPTSSLSLTRIRNFYQIPRKNKTEGPWIHNYLELIPRIISNSPKHDEKAITSCVSSRSLQWSSFLYVSSFFFSWIWEVVLRALIGEIYMERWQRDISKFFC